MSTDTFDITKLSRAMTGKKRCYSTIIRTPWIYGLLSAGIKDNGVFVNGEKSYEDRNHSRPVVDLKSTGAQIKSLRIKSGYTVHDIQAVFGFEYPQAIYAWESGKSIPTIDNLLVLAHLFEISVEEIVIQRMIEVEVSCVSNKIEKLCNKNCNDCKLRLSA